MNQPPAYDDFKKSKIFWVGLSAVLFGDGVEQLPLSALTPSGSLIHSIEQPYRQQLSFYKTNLVKCVPLRDDKIRYPIEHEMEKCFQNFEWELKQLEPNTVFLLGRQVSNFIFKKLGHDKPELPETFRYKPVASQKIHFVPVHHPSYILVYKRKALHRYVSNIQKLILNRLNQ